MTRAASRALCCLALLLSAAPAWAAEETDGDDPGFELTLGAREVYDDNLYRLPEIISPQQALISAASRDDYVRRVSENGKLLREKRWQQVFPRDP